MVQLNGGVGHHNWGRLISETSQGKYRDGGDLQLRRPQRGTSKNIVLGTS